jgi:hypothetical protein
MSVGLSDAMARATIKTPASAMGHALAKRGRGDATDADADVGEEITEELQDEIAYITPKSTRGSIGSATAIVTTTGFSTPMAPSRIPVIIPGLSPIMPATASGASTPSRLNAGAKKQKQKQRRQYSAKLMHEYEVYKASIPSTVSPMSLDDFASRTVEGIFR